MIICKNLSFKYGKRIIFENFNYEFKDNTVTAIVGESGKGKTTLLRCIAGLNKPYEGTIIYKGQNSNLLNKENEKVINSPDNRIFMMHQHYSNFPWKNCLENVLFPLSLNGGITTDIENEAKELLTIVGLNDFNKYPGELSGGMNQRLALVRTIMSKPEVILMDEPMSALDEITRRKMQDLLLNMHEKTKNIIILITHDNNEAKKMGDSIIKF